jgi:DNA (cytosine-5)-methyltransferase 1
MKLLDLFCGAGGASMGYHLAGFEVTGVDRAAMPRYPFTFIQGDALEYLAKHGHEYDVIHASPPCQRYSKSTPMKYKDQHPDLINPFRSLMSTIDKPYVIENVGGAASELINPLMLCGTMFGLPMQRHRYFEVPLLSEKLLLLPPCRHDGYAVLITGSPRHLIDGKRARDYTIPEKQVAIEIDWMTEAEMTQAIPPAYTRWIGQQIKQTLYAIIDI